MPDKNQHYKQEREKLRLTRQKILNLLNEALTNLRAAKEKCSVSIMWTPVEGEIAEIETELEEITTRMPHAEPGLIEK